MIVTKKLLYLQASRPSYFLLHFFYQSKFHSTFSFKHKYISNSVFLCRRGKRIVLCHMIAGVIYKERKYAATWNFSSCRCTCYWCLRYDSVFSLHNIFSSTLLALTVKKQSRLVVLIAVII